MIKIFKLFKKHNTLFFIIAFCFSSCECVISSFQPYLLSLIVQNFQNIYDGNEVQNEINHALQILAIIIGTVLIGFFCRITARFFYIRCAIDIVQRLRNDLFIKLQWIQDQEFNKLSISSIVSRATNDSYQYQEAILSFFLFFFESTILIIGSLIFCIYISPILSTTFLVIIPLVLTINILCNKKAEKHYDTNLNELDAVNRVMRENILGTQTVRSFRLQKYQALRFDLHNKKWYQSIYKGEWLVYFGFIILFFVLNVAVVAVLFISGWINYVNIKIGSQTISVSIVIAFTNYLLYVVFCAFGISNSIVFIIRTKPCINRIEEILKIKSESNIGNDFPTPFVPSLEFENVTYSYNQSNQSKPVLQNLSFKVFPGQILGIIGPTGSGKSTIVLLASNIVEPSKGTIKFGGFTSKQIDFQNIRKQISVAFQEKYIFSGTIKSNLLMGNLNATQVEIERAAQLACANDFIEKTKDQYEAVALQNGNNFSGGQKQRLAIARAFVKNAGIYILDDSLSALDNLTRDKLLANIKNNFSGKTFIIVSQQVKTIKDADQIMVLDKGKIIDVGTHSELIKRCDLYCKIYDSQKTIGD